MPSAPPAAGALDPHVGAAILCIAGPLVAALLALVLGLSDDPERRR